MIPVTKEILIDQIRVQLSCAIDYFDGNMENSSDPTGDGIEMTREALQTAEELVELVLNKNKTVSK